MAARTSKKGIGIFSKGNLVFLTKFGLKDQPEIILEVEDYYEENNVLTASKIILIQKEVNREDEMISLMPLGNAFIFSSINSDGETPKAGQTCFSVSQFDMFGIVENQEIIDLFNKSFSGEATAEPKKTKPKKSNGIML